MFSAWNMEMNHAQFFRRLQRIEGIKLMRYSNDGEEGASFDVLGTYGNVYAVNLNQKKCSCFDSFFPCKHSLFVILKVLRLQNDEAVLTKEIINSRLESIPNNVYATDLTINLFQRYKRRRIVTENCPVCYQSCRSQSTCCAHCGKNIHVQCLNSWLNVGRKTCVWCRKPWRKGVNDEGYLNMADTEGISSDRPEFRETPIWQQIRNQRRRYKRRRRMNVNRTVS